MENKKLYKKTAALAKFLGIGGIEAQDLIEDGDYIVLTDQEADAAAREYILDSVWAFNKSFLDAHSEAIAEIDEKTFRVLQERAESVNGAILKMIDDVDYFVEDAINADGRGHFLSSYDGEENEQDGFYIYRLN
jgi:hypothetical protein